MTVEQFKEKYEALQKEAGEIHREIKPLLKRFKTLSRKCKKLGDGADEEGCEDCDAFALFRLWDLDVVVDELGTLESIEDVLYNLAHVKFARTKRRDKKR